MDLWFVGFLELWITGCLLLALVLVFGVIRLLVCVGFGIYIIYISLIFPWIYHNSFVSRPHAWKYFISRDSLYINAQSKDEQAQRGHGCLEAA